MCISEGYITGYLLIVCNTTFVFVKLWISAFTKYAMAGMYVGNMLSCFSKQRRRLSEKKWHN